MQPTAFVPLATHSSSKRGVNSSFQSRLSSAQVSNADSSMSASSMTTTTMSDNNNNMAVNGMKQPSSSSDNKDDDDDSSKTDIRLSINEMARTVTSVCTSGTLCTISSANGMLGAPFGSFVDYVLDDDGNPVFLMNEMSMHTVNIRQQQNDNNNQEDDLGTGMVTLFCQLGGGKEGQDVSRCSVTGRVERISEQDEDLSAIRMRYSITHAYADQVMDSPKFDFYRLVPSKIYYVGGFGVVASWVNVDAYRMASPDILAREASDIVARLNRHHGDDLRSTATQLLLPLDNDKETTTSMKDNNNDDKNGIEKIRVTSMDRLGMNIRVTKKMAGRRNKLLTNEYRVGFRIPVVSIEDAKSEVLKVFQEAWEKENGYVWEDDVELPGTTVPIVKVATDDLE